eukprot:270358-Prymnesium_polylepis.2
MGMSTHPMMGVLEPLDLRNPAHVARMTALLDQATERALTSEQVARTVRTYIWHDGFMDSVGEDPHDALVMMLLDWAKLGGYAAEPDVGQSQLDEFPLSQLTWLARHIPDDWHF